MLTFHIKFSLSVFETGRSFKSTRLEDEGINLLYKHEHDM